MDATGRTLCPSEPYYRAVCFCSVVPFRGILPGGMLFLWPVLEWGVSVFSTSYESKAQSLSSLDA